MAVVDEDGLVQAVRGRLAAELPALLEAAELPEMQAFLDYEPLLSPATQAPLVWVDAASASRSAAGARGATLHKYSVETVLMVGVMVAGESNSEASGRLRRCVRWVRKAVEGDQTVDGNALWALWQATDYSPPLAKGTGLVKLAILTFDVNHRVGRGE